jgi:hypothetical protein
MHHPYPGVETPPDDTIIWRYINLERLLALLLSSSLYLCRFDHLRDPWEGRWPNFRVAQYGGVEDPLARELGFVTDETIRWFKELPKQFFVSCWHENAYQSAAFWDQYGNSGGLAIRSTVGRLKTSGSFPGAYIIGRVRYIDYERPEEAKNACRWSSHF